MPRQPALSRSDIVDAAMAIAEARGIDAVSMRAVANRLGVTPMALYHHVRDKQGLIDAVVERLLGALPIPDPALPWRQRLEQLAEQLRETAARDPEAFIMLLRRPAETPGSQRPRTAVYEALRDAGAPDELVPRLERMLSTFMIGFAASETAGRFSAHDRATLDADLAWTIDSLVALITSREG